MRERERVEAFERSRVGTCERERVGTCERERVGTYERKRVGTYDRERVGTCERKRVAHMIDKIHGASWHVGSLDNSSQHRATLGKWLCFSLDNSSSSSSQERATLGKWLCLGSFEMWLCWLRRHGANIAWHGANGSFGSLEMWRCDSFGSLGT